MQRFLDLFISINSSTCFRRFLRPSSGAQKCIYSVRYCQTNTATLYMFQAVPQPIIRSTKVYIQRQVLSNQYCCYSTCFRRFLRLSSGAQKCTYSVRYYQTNTAACCYRGWDGTPFHLIHDTSKQQYWFENIWRCIYTFVLLVMDRRTAWNM